MRDVLHFVGVALAFVGAVLSLLCEGSSDGCALAVVLGAFLALVTHKAGVHGPPDEWCSLTSEEHHQPPLDGGDDPLRGDSPRGPATTAATVRPPAHGHEKHGAEREDQNPSDEREVVHER